MNNNRNKREDIVGKLMNRNKQFASTYSETPAQKPVANELDNSLPETYDINKQITPSQQPVRDNWKASVDSLDKGYGPIDWVKDAFTDWKINQNNANIDARGADAIWLYQKQKELEQAQMYVNILKLLIQHSDPSSENFIEDDATRSEIDKQLKEQLTELKPGYDASSIGAVKAKKKKPTKPKENLSFWQKLRKAWVNNTISSMVAENPAYAAAVGWQQDEDGDWNQDAVNDEGVKQLRHNLMEIGMSTPMGPGGLVTKGAGAVGNIAKEKALYFMARRGSKWATEKLFAAAVKEAPTIGKLMMDVGLMNTAGTLTDLTVQRQAENAYNENRHVLPFDSTANYDAQLNQINSRLEEVSKLQLKNQEDIKEYQDANEMWLNRHQISEYYKKKAEDNDMSFWDIDTYLYKLPGTAGSSASSWKTQLAAWTIGLATRRFAVGATARTLGTLGTFGMNFYGAMEENKAEVYEAYKDKVKELAQADGSLQAVLKEATERLGKTDMDDDKKLDAILMGAVDVGNVKFNKHRMDAFEGTNSLYQDDMFAVAGDAAFDTALEVMPFGKVAKSTKYGKKAYDVASKAGSLWREAGRRIDDLATWTRHLNADKLSKGVWRKYWWDVAKRAFLSANSEMIEESSQYLNAKKYKDGVYDGDDRSFLMSILGCIENGGKSVFAFYNPWDTAMTSDREWLENARGGFLMGFGNTGAQNLVAGVKETLNLKSADQFVSELATSNRLYEKDLINKGKYYASSALKGKERNVLMAFDKLHKVEGMEDFSELIDQEKERASWVMNVANSKSFKKLAEANGIKPDTDQYAEIVSTYAYYNQMYQDAVEGYREARKKVDEISGTEAYKRFLSQYMDYTDPVTGETKTLDPEQIKNTVAFKKSLYDVASQRKAIETYISHMQRVNEIYNGNAPETYIKYAQDILKDLDENLEKQGYSKEDLTDDVLEPYNPMVESYYQTIPFLVDMRIAQDKIKGFDLRNPGSEQTKKFISAIVQGREHVTQDDIRLQQDIMDDYNSDGVTDTEELEDVVDDNESEGTNDDTDILADETISEDEASNGVADQDQTDEEGTVEAPDWYVTDDTVAPEELQPTEESEGEQKVDEGEKEEESEQQEEEPVQPEEGEKSDEEDAVKKEDNNSEAQPEASSQKQEEARKESEEPEETTKKAPSTDLQLDEYGRTPEEIALAERIEQRRKQLGVKITTKKVVRSKSYLAKRRKQIAEMGDDPSKYTDEQLSVEVTTEISQETKYGVAIAMANDVIDEIHGILLPALQLHLNLLVELTNDALHAAEARLLNPSNTQEDIESIRKDIDYYRMQSDGYSKQLYYTTIPNRTRYFVENEFDDMDEVDLDNSLRLLLDTATDVQDTRDVLSSLMMDAESDEVLDKYYKLLKDSLAQAEDLLNQLHSKQQAESARSKDGVLEEVKEEEPVGAENNENDSPAIKPVEELTPEQQADPNKFIPDERIEYARTSNTTDAQLDGIVGATFADNEAYYLSSTQPDFITESTISFEQYGNAVYVIFNYKGQAIRTKFKPNLSNTLLLGKLINAIQQVKEDPSKSILLIGLSRTYGRFLNANANMLLTESLLWDSSIGIMDITPENTKIGISTGSAFGSQVRVNGETISEGINTAGGVYLITHSKKLEGNRTRKPLFVKLNPGKFINKPGTASLLLDLILSNDKSVKIGDQTLPFTPQQLLDLLVHNGVDTMVSDDAPYTQAQREALIKKLFCTDGNGGIWIGDHLYDISQLNSDPNIRKQAIQYIQDNFTNHINEGLLLSYAISKDCPLSGLKNWFKVNGVDKITVIPGELEFTAEQAGLKKNSQGMYVDDAKHGKGISMIGWYIQNGSMLTDVKRMVNANIYFKDIEIATNEPTEKDKALLNDPIQHAEEKDESLPLSIEDLFSGLEPGANYATNAVIKDKMLKDQAAAYISRVLGLSSDQILIAHDVIGITQSGMKILGQSRVDAIELSELAPKGIEYHEAWHRVSNLLIDAKKRNKIFERARKKYKGKVSDQRIDEDLAEQFREFMLTNEQAMNDLQAANWFRKIKTFINVWSKVGNLRLAKLYYDINLGKFSGIKPSQENIDRFNKLYGNTGAGFEIRGTKFDTIPTRSDYDNIVKGLTYAAVTMQVRRFTDKKGLSNIFMHVDKVDLDKLRQSCKGKGSAVMDEIYQKWDIFAKDIYNQLRDMSVKFKQQQEDEENKEAEEPNKNTDIGEHTKASYEVSLYDNAPAAVKFFFRTLPQYVYNTDGKIVLKKEPLTGFPRFNDGKFVWNIISNDLHACNSIQQMKLEIDRRSANDLMYFALKTQFDKLIKNSKSEDHAVAMDAEVLLTLLYVTVHSHIHDFLTIKTNQLDGGGNSVSIVDNTVDVKARTLPNMWGQQLMRGNIFTYQKDGNVAWKENGQKTLTLLINRFENIKDSLLNNKPYNPKGDQEYDINTPEGIDKIKSDIVSLFGMLGVTVDKGTINQMLKDPDYGNNETSELSKLTQFVASTKKFGGFTGFINLLRGLKDNADVRGLNGMKKRVGDKEEFVRTQDLYQQSGFIKELANNYVQWHNNSDEMISYAAGGNLLYPKSQNNFFTDRVSELNTDVEVSKQLRRVPYSEPSLILSQLLDTRTKLKVSTFVNFKTSQYADTGSDYFDITAKEDYIAKLTLTTNDHLISPTVADKKTYHAISGLKLFHGKIETQADKGIVHMQFDDRAVDQFLLYAKADLAAATQCIQQLEGYTDDEGIYHAPIDDDLKVKNYHTKAKYKDSKGVTHEVEPNGTRFRFLTGIYKWQKIDGKMQKVFIDFTDPHKSSKELIDLAKREFFDLDIKAQRSIINDLIQERVQDELKYATELGVIEKNGRLYSSELIDKAQISNSARNYYKTIDGSRELNEAERNHYAIMELIANHCINTIVSVNEIERVFSGDPAFYKWTYNEHGLVENSIDKIKRLGALTSTGENNRTDIEGIPQNYTVCEFQDYEKGSDIYLNTIKPYWYTGSLISSVRQLHGEDALFNEDGSMYTQEQLEEKYPDAVKYAEIATEKEAAGYAKDINVADAAVYVSVDMYRNMMRQIGEWGIEQEEAYNLLQSDDNVWAYSPRDAAKVRNAFLKPLKYMAFGNRIQNGLSVPYFNKMALFPVFEYVATGDMKAVYDLMKERGADMVMFNSAVKSGSLNAQSFYGEDGNVQDFSKFTTYQQDFKYLRHQLKTDPHEHELSMLGTLMLKVVLSNLGLKMQYGKEGEKVTGQYIKEQVFASMNAISDYGRAEVQKTLCNEDGTINEEKFAKTLREEAETQGANDNMLNGLATQNGKLTIPLSALSNTGWLESREISFINKHTVDLNLPGGSFIQRSAFGIANRDLRYKTERMLNDGLPLKLINEEGSMDAIISINMFKHIIPDYNKKTFYQARQWLIEHNIIGKEANANSVGYRIPTQSQASISALRFVDVLPEVMGDTVVLPEEFTKLTGSDFDVDKLFISRFAYDKEGNIVQFDHSKSHIENSKEANGNNLIDCFLKVLLTKEHTNDLKISIDNDTENVKTVLADIESLKKESHVLPLLQYSPKYQSEKKEEYTGGKAGIGPFALNNAHHVLTQLTDLNFANNALTEAWGITSLSKVFDDVDQNRDGSRKRVLSWLSAMINAFVDIAKDPYIVRLNVNSYTYNIASFLLRTGKGENTFYFLNQPIMIDIANEVLKTRGKYGVDQHMSQSLREEAAIQKVLMKYDYNANKKLYENVKTDKQKADVYGKLFDKDFLRNMMMHPTNENQIYIYQAFLELNRYAQAMSDLVKFSKIDTKKMGKSFAEQRVYDNGMSELARNELFAPGQVQRFYDETFLSVKRRNSIHLGRDLFASQLIRNTYQVMTVADNILSLINRSSTADANLLNVVYRAIESSIKSQFFNQRMAKRGITARDLFYGDKSIANKLADIKQQIYSGQLKGMLDQDGVITNKLLEYLMSNSGKFEKSYEKPDFLDTYSMFDSDVSDQNTLIDSWLELYDSNIPELHNLAEDLIDYSFLTSGDNPGMNTFFNYLPIDIRRRIGYAEYIGNAMESLNDPTKVSLVSIDDIYLNNWQNDALVKPVAYTVYDQKIDSDAETGERGLVNKKYNFVGVLSKYALPDLKYPVLEALSGVRDALNPQFDIKPIKWVLVTNELTGKTVSKPVFPKYIKIKYTQQRTPSNTLVYQQIGLIEIYNRETRNKEYKPVYMIVNKKGYNMQGHKIIEYGRSDKYSFNNFPVSMNAHDAMAAVGQQLAKMYPNCELSLLERTGDIWEDTDNEETQYGTKTETQASLRKTYEGIITELADNQVFVFGSNTEGRHGKGAALTAKDKFGAVYGQAEGAQGQSYAIITKDLTSKTQPSRTKELIEEQINKFYDYAQLNPEKEFLVAYSGTGTNLNAYSNLEMAQMFASTSIPLNVVFEKSFNDLVEKELDARLANETQEKQLSQAAQDAIKLVGLANVDQTVKTMLSDDSQFTLSEKKSIKSILGDIKPRVLVASETTDPVFHVKKIKEMVEEEMKKPPLERKFHMMYLITKHDGLPLKELAKLPIKKYYHFSITSLGGTKYEPGVMKTDDMLDRIEALIKDKTLDPNLITIRIDPIIPGVTNSDDIRHIVERASKMGIRQFKFSVMDSYGYTENGGKTQSQQDRFIIQRMSELGYDWDTYYGRNKDGIVNFDAKPEIISQVYHYMDSLADEFKIWFNTCGERPRFITGLKHIRTDVGCISVDSMNAAMGTNDIANVEGNQRKECSCYGLKSDALRYTDSCASSCIYCYAKHNSNSAMKYYNEDGTLKNNAFTQTTESTQQNSKQSDIELWSEKEGWSAEYFNDKVLPRVQEGWQMEFKLADDQNGPYKFRGTMNYKYGNQSREGIKSTSTIDAILAGERTATTRFESDGAVDYWKSAKVGDVIQFYTGDKTVNVVVTSALQKLTDKYPLLASIQTGSDNTIDVWSGSKEHGPSNAALSNFAYRPFSHQWKDGSRTQFSSVEQAFLYVKARYYSDASNEQIQAILSENNGTKLKQLGRSVPGLKSEQWNATKEKFMKAFIKESMLANPTSLNLLLSTGNATITHVNDKGEYKVLFPKVLTEVRNELRNIQQQGKVKTVYQGRTTAQDNRRYNYYTLSSKEASDYGTVTQYTVNTDGFLQVYNGVFATQLFVDLQKEFYKTEGKYFDVLDNSEEGLERQRRFFLFVESKGYKGLDFITNNNSVLTSDQGKFLNAYLVSFNQDSYMLHSGGAIGSDTMWSLIGKQMGVLSDSGINHYYHGEKTPNGNVEISQEDYDEGKYKVALAAKANYGYNYGTMKNDLLIRDWSQVKHADAVFAIGHLVNKGESLFPNQKNDTRIARKQAVQGGTGYAVEMAIQEGKPVYVFDLNSKQWYSNLNGEWSECSTPVLTKNFAGIGTRNINADGEQAIRDVYTKTLESNDAAEESAREQGFDDWLKDMDKEGERVRKECNGGE